MENIDEFEKRLNEKSKELNECQQKKGIDSCLKCELLLECELRDSYVKAVYESMNKGKGGGFEF